MFDKRQNKEQGGLKRAKKTKKETSFTVRRRANWR